MNAVLLLLVPAAPLLLACSGVIGAARLRRLTPWTAAPGLMVALLLPEGTLASYPWLLLGLELQLDAIGRSFLLLTAGLWGAAGLYALGYLREDAHAGRFHLWFLLAMSGNLGLVLAADAVGFYLFFSLMSLASYGLVIHAGGAEVMRAGRIYLILAVLGEILLLAGLLFAVFSAGGTHFSLLAATPLEVVPATLLVLGLGIKAGLIPLHVWLPLAHPAAPTPASAVLSGAMIKAGLLGWLRLLDPTAAGWPELGAGLLILGLTGAFFAAAIGVLQQRPKTVLAYSSISQMGIMASALGLALLLPGQASPLLAAVVLYSLHHGFAKGALFLGVGIAERHRGPWVMAILALPGLALCGLPWTSGALAKSALKAGLQEAPPVWVGPVETLLTATAVGTTLLVARFLWLIGATSPGVGRPIPWQMLGPWLALSSIALLLPWLWPGTADMAWSLMWPLAAGLLLAAIALIWRRGAPIRVPEGDLLIPVEALMLGLARRVRATPWLWRALGEGPLRARARLLWRHAGRGAASLEKGLGRWESIGTLFMVLVLVVFLLLFADGAAAAYHRAAP